MMKEMNFEEMMSVNGGTNTRTTEAGGGSTPTPEPKPPIEKVVKETGGLNTSRVLAGDMRGGCLRPKDPLALN